MGKSKTNAPLAVTPVASKKIDPTLASLFESSLGVVKAPEHKSHVASEDGSPEGEDDDEELSEVEDSEASCEGYRVPEPDTTTDRDQKRKRKVAEEELEDAYMRKLHEDKAKPRSKKVKAGKEEEIKPTAEDGDEGADSDFESMDFPLKHESLMSPVEAELDKSIRTVFLGNVPSNAISSKADYKTLKRFFSAAGKISSVRFRSVAFSEQIPRKAAFVNHKLHEKQKTVNAYIVYKDVASAREALKFNGSVVLDRHIRVDSVAHPGKQETRQCVFVGNLDFEAQEENLWRHFGRCGKVQYVRVVRDSKTNVGKGFAYVQFEDPMSVEQALLLDGKKMEGDRKLRITPAKAFKRSAKDRHPTERQRQSAPKTNKVYIPKADPKQQATVGRATKLLGRAGATALKKKVQVFEGLRATADTDSGIKKGGTGKKKRGKARARTTNRSTAWKKK